MTTSDFAPGVYMEFANRMSEQPAVTSSPRSLRYPRTSARVRQPFHERTSPCAGRAFVEAETAGIKIVAPARLMSSSDFIDMFGIRAGLAGRTTRQIGRAHV